MNKKNEVVTIRKVTFNITEEQKYETTLTKPEVENKIENGDLQHKVVSFGKQNGDYVSKYVIDLQILPTATELRFYADETGKSLF